MAELKARFLTGAPRPAFKQPPEWSVLRERIACLTANNEVTRNLTQEISKLIVNVDQQLSIVEQKTKDL
jgi:hypothetical protein